MTTGFSFNPFTSNLDLVTLTLTPSGITGGTINTIAGFDGTGTLESIPNWFINTDTGGLSMNINLAPADAAATYIFVDIVNSITPTVDLLTLDFVNERVYLNLVGPNDFHQVRGLQVVVNKTDTGTVSYLSGEEVDVSIGDGTNSTTVTDFNLVNYFLNVNPNGNITNNSTLVNIGANLQAGTVIGGLSGLNINITEDGTSTQNFNILTLNTNINVSQPAGTGLNAIGMGSNIYGDLQYYSGIYNNVQFQTGANIAQGASAFQDNANVMTGTTLLGGLQSYGANAQIHPGAAVNGYTGMNLNPGIDAAMAGGQGVNIITGGGGYTAAMQYLNLCNLGGNLNSGAAVTDGINGYTNATNMQSGSSASYMVAYADYANVHAGATLTSYTGLNITPNIDAALSGSLTLAQLNFSGSGSAAFITGLDINVSTFTATSGRNVALSINGGVINAGGSFTTASSLGVDSLNQIGPVLNINSGTPITGTSVFGQNLANIILAADDFGAGPLGLSIGTVAFVALVDVAPGKTVDSIAAAVSGAQFQNGGTTTDFMMYDAIGALDGGGSPIVTNQYAFRFNPVMSGFVPNTWGISIEDPLAENFIKKSLAIDTATKKVTNASVGLELGGTTKAVRLSVLTTAERNALTALSGMTIFNDTTDTLDYYDGTSWVTNGNGTVTSVDITVPSILTVTGNPITTSGTLALTLANQSANTVFAGPASGGAAAPTFRALVSADIPNNAANTTGTASNVTGVVAIANGGTGQTSQTAAFDALAPTTTKGDIIVHNGTDNIRVAVGTDGYVPVADSGAASGISWQAQTAAVYSYAASSGSELLSTIGASGNYGALSTSVSLTTPGLYRVVGQFYINSSNGVDPALLVESGFFETDGANSATAPTALSSTFDGSNDWATMVTDFALGPLPTGSKRYASAPNEIFITVTTTQDIYLVPRIDFSSTGSSTVYTKISAVRIQ